ncbi:MULTISPECIES: pyridoxamine 5'-phosphate oxidase [Nocardia]|uniref:pyridoxamine 5'-phosphate oxidase n=1 Tax=Nocardia TaxID=1817 RepID=UPI0018953B61|nr:MULTISPECIES: pyridoxamine 5'-phosphate oxidase [Nocardia]MBF6349559.1 pyridoxamine 5'-phosphate oxidase [Nocardia flavorosea]
MSDVEESGADLAAMRAEYDAAHSRSREQGPLLGVRDTELDENSVAGGWEPLLRQWIDQATAAGIAEPNAMVLGTLDSAGPAARPVTRTVLCKGLSPDGVTFYTNYDSAKGAQLAAAPYASATFLWPQLARQAHIRGRVERVPAGTTEAYWRSRPRESQLGAWASEQSRPIASREELDRRLVRATARFATAAEIPVPPHWGGYLLRPDEVEFWQGRRGRLHNRILVRIGATGMSVQRLQP